MLPKLRHLSLRGNPLGRIEDFLFGGLRESPVKEVNLQNCEIKTISSLAFSHLKTLEHVDFFGNKIFSPDAPIFDFAQSMRWLEHVRIRNLGLAQTQLEYVPRQTLNHTKGSLTKLNLAENKIKQLGLVAPVLQERD